ncbi:MAG: hypothetical protein JXM70_26835 [Pirellulales bacterium]|nr:hypothetical protein [Pirellulales bacterium]
MRRVYCIIVCLTTFAGCAYDVPVFVTIETSETAFNIKLEGEADQATLKSEEYLRQNMISTKRVQITYHWVSQGYWVFNGKYLPNERIIVVDRAPETREWVADPKRGTSQRDEGIWVESSDSVGFSTGISITARIANEDDAVKFLYNYPPKSNRTVKVINSFKDDYAVGVAQLADIMDGEVRTKIQEVFAEKAAEYNMDELRSKKKEIIAEIRQQVIPFFAQRGITITAIGMFGGFTYENPEIQQAIDQVFKAQQDEEVAKAEAMAARERKEALKLKGEGEAQQKVEMARGQTEAIKLEAEAKAAAITSVADAKAYELEKLTANPEAYLMLKKLEIEEQRMERWNGQYPHYYFGSTTDTGLNLFVPTPEMKAETNLKPNTD